MNSLTGMTLLMFIFTLFPLLANAETVYNSIYEQGNVVFSDQLSAPAEKLHIEAAPAAAFRTLTVPVRQEIKTTQENLYKQLLILAQENEQSVRDNPPRHPEAAAPFGFGTSRPVQILAYTTA